MKSDVTSSNNNLNNVVIVIFIIFKIIFRIAYKDCGFTNTLQPSLDMNIAKLHSLVFIVDAIGHNELFSLFLAVHKCEGVIHEDFSKHTIINTMSFKYVIIELETPQIFFLKLSSKK